MLCRQAIQVGDNTYMTTVHVAAPSNTTAGIIFSIPETDAYEDIQSSIFNYSPELPHLGSKETRNIKDGTNPI